MCLVRIKGLLVRACLIAGLLLLCDRMSALEPTHSITQYAHKGWTVKEGQLPGSVMALAQTSDGSLWLGTQLGLLRFDGVRFLPGRPSTGRQLASEYINALGAGHDGSLWIGTRAGLSQLTRGSLRNYPASKSSTGVADILVDRSGAVWAGTAAYGAGGLCRVEGKGLRCDDGKGNGAPGFVLSLLEDHSGNLWAGGAGGLRRWRPGVPR